MHIREGHDVQLIVFPGGLPKEVIKSRSGGTDFSEFRKNNITSSTYKLMSVSAAPTSRPSIFGCPLFFRSRDCNWLGLSLPCPSLE